MPSNDDLQQELLRGLKEAFDSKAAASELQHQVAELKRQLDDAEKRLVEASAQTEAIEQRNTDLMSSLFSNGKKNGASAAPADGSVNHDTTGGHDIHSERRDTSDMAGRNTKRQKTSDHPLYIPEMLSETYPTVVLIDGQWTEIWCDECGANTSTHGFFKGTKGLQLHMSKFHREFDTIEEIVARCDRRIMSDGDVERIRMNGSPMVRIQNILPPTPPNGQRSAGSNVDQELARSADMTNGRPRRKSKGTATNGDTASEAANDSTYDNDTDTREYSDLASIERLASAKRRRPSDYHSNTPALSEAFPTMVCLDGKWTEIWCDECGANAGSTGQFGGMKGLHMHKRKAHAQTGPHVFENVRAAARRRVLSSEDVKRVRNGQAPLVKIKRVLPPNPERSLAGAGVPLDKEQESRQPSADSDDVSVDDGVRTARSQRSSIGKATKKPDTREPLEGLHVDYPTIIFLDDQWMEIWCRSCGANASRTHGRFFSGKDGLHHHNRKCRRKTSFPSTFQEVTEACGRRAVSSEDVARIQEGRKPLVKIEKMLPPMD